jgi:hypothetical protein|eukprot:g7367.t1
MYNSPEGKKTDSANYSDEDIVATPNASETSEQRSPYAISFAGMSKVQDGEDASPFPTAFEKEEAEARGDEVVVYFTTSSGKEYENGFGYGQTVQVLKSWLDSEQGIEYAKQQLYLGDDASGQMMIDPLSLNDFPAIQPGKTVKIFVAVTGDEKPSSSHK